MRVIEPKQKNYHSAAATKKLFFGLSALVVIILGSYLFTLQHPKSKKSTLGVVNQGSSADVSSTTNGTKFLNSYEFQKLYDATAYPNTTQLQEPPEITGDQTADARIRQIAESRGYKFQPVPVSAIVKSELIQDTNTNLLQRPANDGLRVLLSLAKTDHIPLVATTGYRPIELQRQLFNQQLNEAGLSSAKIISGSGDDKVIGVLLAVSPPGYSRHQTGYGVDLACAAPNTSAFELSVCANWLKQSNFSHAKQAGFIPSRIENSGPPPINTQVAEYVWVGSSAFN